MSNIQTSQKTGILSPEIVEKVLLGGDLERLQPAERISYYSNVCESLGLNPLTKPFDYLKLNNKLVLYANKGCTDQLRRQHEITVNLTAREKFDEIFVVSSRAKTTGGREDESTGAVNIAGLKGEALANAMMKAETKSKRRVTLSICGLGMLDESEVDSIKDAKRVSHDEAETMPAREGAVETIEGSIVETGNPWDMRIPTHWNSPDAGKTFRQLDVKGVSALVNFLKNKITNPTAEHKSLLFFADLALRTPQSAADQLGLDDSEVPDTAFDAAKAAP